MMGFRARRLWLGLVAALGAAPAQAQSPTVKFGGIEQISGKYGTYGQQVAMGMKIAAKEINDAGGVKIGLDIEDSGNDSTEAVTLLRKFSGSSDVTAVIGPMGTADLLTVLPLSSQAGLPIVSVASSTDFPPNRFGKWLVRVSLRETPGVIKSVLDRARQARNLHTIALLQDRTNDFAQAESKAVRKAVADSGGALKLVGEESYAAGDKDFAALLDKATQSKPDALWLAGFVNEVSLIMQQARARGYKGVFIGGGGLTDPTIAKIAQSAATGTITFLPFNAQSDAPEVRHLVDGYHAAGGAGDVPTYVAYGYDAVKLLANAVNKAKSSDRAKVMEAVGKTKDLHLATGVYTFEGKGDNVAPPSPFLVEISPSGAYQPMRP